MKGHSYRQPNDTVTIERNVLLTIAKAAALSIPGVERIGYASGTIDRMLKREPSEDGVHLTVEDDSVTVDVYLVVDAQQNLREVCAKVQEEISRTIQQYVGMTAQAVNVHIEDVIFESSES